MRDRGKRAEGLGRHRVALIPLRLITAVAKAKIVGTCWQSN